jgi:hypothetical protein
MAAAATGFKEADTILRTLAHLSVLLTVVCMGTTSASAAAENKEKLFFQSEASAPEGKTLVVESGEDVILSCEAAGRPSPVIHWLRDGVRLHQAVGLTRNGDAAEVAAEAGDMEGRLPLELSSTRARLFIDCARESDAAVYTCVAETTNKRIARSTVLFVEARKMSSAGQHCVHKRPITVTSLVDSEPARLNMWTSMTLDFEGSDAMLFCRAEGRPAPTVTWFDRNNRRIQPNDAHYTILGSGDLVIHEVNWNKHMGIYRCVAENSGGTDEVETFLYPTRL